MPAACVVTAAVTLIALPACDQAEKQARASASQAAGQAKDKAKAKAAELVVDQACALTKDGGPLADGKVSAADRALVAPLVSAADAADVGPKLVGTLRTLAESGASESDQAAALAQLEATCAG
jgi:hypothetical protein